MTEPWARARPPRQALAWAAASVGHGSRVIGVRALAGSWLAVHAVDIREPSGWVHRLVLRRWVRPDWQSTDPDFTASREAAILRALERTTIPTPRLVALDADGSSAGAPAVLLTRIDGRVPSLSASRRSSLVRELGRRLVEIHALGTSFEAVAPPFAFYYQLERFEPPAVTRRPDLWRAAAELASGSPPNGHSGFIHRDYHPWNTLWRGGRMTGIIDWTGASWGSPGVDLGHLRWNLAAEHEPSVAEVALQAYRDAGGDPPDGPWWDVRMLLDAIPDNDADHVTGEGLHRVERYLMTLLA
jgi:aminoglycoside phosphotransferase (APT) family kinase protein